MANRVTRRQFMTRSGIALGGAVIAPQLLAACGSDDDSGDGGSGGRATRLRGACAWEGGDVAEGAHREGVALPRHLDDEVAGHDLDTVADDRHVERTCPLLIRMRRRDRRRPDRIAHRRQRVRVPDRAMNDDAGASG